MLFSVEQAFVGRDERRAPLKTPAWEARAVKVMQLLLLYPPDGRFSRKIALLHVYFNGQISPLRLASKI